MKLNQSGQLLYLLVTYHNLLEVNEVRRLRHQKILPTDLFDEFDGAFSSCLLATKKDRDLYKSAYNYCKNTLKLINKEFKELEEKKG